MEKALLQRSKATGRDLSQTIRDVIGKEFGVSGKLPANGLETLTKKQRSEIGKRGAAARHSLKRKPSRFTFAGLRAFADQHGVEVEKRGKLIEWWRRDNHSVVGVCRSIGQAYNEIAQEN